MGPSAVSLPRSVSPFGGTIAGSPERILPWGIMPAMAANPTAAAATHGADHGTTASVTATQGQGAARRAGCRRIEGQVRGIARMIEREEYCVDILQQTAALRAAVDAVSILVLEDHVQGCVRTAAERGEADQYVDEVVDVVRRTLGRPVRGRQAGRLTGPAWTRLSTATGATRRRRFVDKPP